VIWECIVELDDVRFEKLLVWYREHVTPLDFWCNSAGRVMAFRVRNFYVKRFDV
jgi:hypothetical protein